jgi:hypothetical protein
MKEDKRKANLLKVRVSVCGARERESTGVSGGGGRGV